MRNPLTSHMFVSWLQRLEKPCSVYSRLMLLQHVITVNSRLVPSTIIHGTLKQSCQESFNETRLRFQQLQTICRITWARQTGFYFHFQLRAARNMHRSIYHMVSSLNSLPISSIRCCTLSVPAERFFYSNWIIKFIKITSNSTNICTGFPLCAFYVKQCGE